MARASRRDIRELGKTMHHDKDEQRPPNGTVHNINLSLDYHRLSTTTDKTNLLITDPCHDWKGLEHIVEHLVQRIRVMRLFFPASSARSGICLNPNPPARWAQKVCHEYEK